MILITKKKLKIYNNIQKIKVLGGSKYQTVIIIYFFPVINKIYSRLYEKFKRISSKKIVTFKKWSNSKSSLV